MTNVDFSDMCSRHFSRASLDPSCSSEGGVEALVANIHRVPCNSVSKIFLTSPTVLDGRILYLQPLLLVTFHPCSLPDTRFLCCAFHAHNHVLTRAERSVYNSRSWIPIRQDCFNFCASVSTGAGAGAGALWTGVVQAQVKQVTLRPQPGISKVLLYW